MKTFKSSDTPNWKEIEVMGKPLKHALTYLEYEEAYNTWIPKDSFPFNKLFDMVLPHCGMGTHWIEKRVIVTEFENIFNQIQDGLNRKQALTLFLREISLYLLDAKTREMQKADKFNSYYKNHKQKVEGNQKSAIKVYESLISEGSREGTKTTQLANLLIEYVNQCDKILDSEEQIIEPLEIKDYKFHQTRTKVSIRECLEKIIKEYDIAIDSFLFNVAIESIKANFLKIGTPHNT